MTLEPQRELLINEMRSAYLQKVDSDQTKRMIRPFTGCFINDKIDLNIHNFVKQQRSDDWKELMSNVESPPIPVNVLDDEELFKKLNNTGDLGNDIIQENDEDMLIKVPTSNTINTVVVKPDSDLSIVTGTAKKQDQSFKSTALQPIKEDNHRHDLLKNLPKSTLPQFTKLFRSSGSSGSLSKAKKSSSNRKKARSQGFDDFDDFDEDDDESDVTDMDDTMDTIDDEDEDGNDDTEGDNGNENDDDNDDDSDDDNDNDDEMTNDNDNDNDTTNDITNDDTMNKLKVTSNTIKSRKNTINESGILIDENYSDENSESQSKFNDTTKYLYPNNSISSMDDDEILLADSDFTDDENLLNDSDLITPVKSTGAPRGQRKSVDFRRTKKRSESLNFEKINSLQNYGKLLRYSKSNSNLQNLSVKQDAPSELKFNKVDIDVSKKAHNKSSLTEIINKSLKQSNKHPLDYFSILSGDKLLNKSDILHLKVYLSNDEILNVKIRKNISVFEAIGYILYTIMNSDLKFKQKLSESEVLQNPNKWCIKLVDEDGEPYEGSFGLLDRTKQINSYGEDEVFLSEVSNDDYLNNEKITPLVTDSIEDDSTTKKKLRQTDYYKTILPKKIDNKIKDSKTVTIKVFNYPFKFDDDFIKLDFQLISKLNEILVKSCKLKDLDPNDYVLKVVGEDYVLDLNDSISSLDGSYQLELLTKRKSRELNLKKKKVLNTDISLATINSGLTPHELTKTAINADLQDSQQQQQQQNQAQIQRRHSFSSHKPLASSFTKHGLSSSFKTRNNSKQSLMSSSFNKLSKFKSQTSADTSLLPNIISSEYQKYTVWRRLPMSFINRHERTFAIDGEYVYIIPNDDKNWYDNSYKTTTFHVSQIISCKVSKSVPQNFKIVVQKANGPKRYDFEAMSPQQSKEIINKLQLLMQAYKMNN